MTHLLDSSAFLAFFFAEPGGDRVAELLEAPAVSVGISALTAIEWWARLKAAGREDAFATEWHDHLPLFEQILPADLEVALKAVELRRSATGRLPTIDSLIAATAALATATLVHRDPHFDAIPADLLQRLAV
jgi:predicted nucleic acid-binding protein